MAFRPHARSLFLRFRLGRMALLWLVLVLAGAQTIAIGHPYSHGPGEPSSQSAGKHAGSLAHCNLCIVAASIGGGAPPASAVFIGAVLREAVPLSTLAVELFAPPYQPYAIRAPPSLLA